MRTLRLLPAALAAVLLAPLAASAQVPTDGLTVWLRADAGVTSNAAGEVTQWADQSANGWHATPSSAAARPTLQPSGPGGRPAVAFDHDVLVSTGSPSFHDAMTLFVVGSMESGSDADATYIVRKQPTSPGQYYRIARSGAGSTPNTAALAYSLDTPSVRRVHAEVREGAHTILTGRFTRQMHQFLVNGGQAEARADSGPLGQGGVPLYLGASPVVSAPGTFDGFLKGAIAEVVIYNRALTDAERQTVERYLSAKYAVPLAGEVPFDGLALWLRADRGVTADASGLVQRWADASGTLNDAVADGGIFAPHLDAAGPGGRPTIRFDGDREYLRVPDAPELNPDRLTLFVVGRMDEASPRFAPFVLKTSDFNWNDGYGLADRAESPEGARTTEFFVSDWNLHFAERRTALGQYALYTGRYDGAAVGLRVGGAPAPPEPPTEYAGAVPPTAQPLYLGASSDGAGAPVREFLRGGVAEVLLYGRALSDAERATVEAYLAARYVLTPVAAVGAPAAPGAASLVVAGPNPARGAARIAYALAHSGPVRLAAYDALGREVAVLHEGDVPAGPHTATFDASSLPAGVYFVRLDADGTQSTRPLTVIR